MTPAFFTSLRGTRRAILVTAFALGAAAAAPSADAQCFPEWSALGSGFNSTVNDLAVVNFGSGDNLFAGGSFSTADGLPQLYMARWTGAFWAGMPTVNNTVNCLLAHNDGGGNKLYAAGEFTSAGSAANRIAVFDGIAWSPLGSGLNGSVFDMASIPSGPLAGLYVAGNFTTAGGVPANRIARWSGGTWSALGAGANAIVRGVASFDAGFGPALYITGEFLTAGGLPASRIARWDGFSWSPLGAGLNNNGRALASYNSGTGNQLYVGGTFTTAGGITVNRIARWNGASWTAVGTGANSTIEELRSYNDGASTKLVAGGVFTSISGVTANRVAAFNGTEWTALGTGVNNTVSTLRAFDDGGGPSLIVGGTFTTANGIAVGRVARFRGCPDSVVAVPGCASNPAELVGITVLPKVGQVFSCRVDAGFVQSGVAILLTGISGVNLAGCGVFLPTLGEVLLAPAPPPAALIQQAYAGGSSVFNLALPNIPTLVGQSLPLQAAVIGLTLPFPLELSTGLVIKIRP